MVWNGALKNSLVWFLLFLAVIACKEESPRPAPSKAKEEVYKPRFPVPEFNADSAFKFIEEQVAFGPRVPNSKAHQACAEYLKKKITDYGLELIVQEAEVVAFNNERLQIQNIMGQFDPENKKRIMLFAHWDTRPFADMDSQDRTKPIDGANDGASGVAVLLEIARVLSLEKERLGENPLNYGIDIVFFDAEDYGKPEGTLQEEGVDTWCLGSQYWAKNIPIPDYSPKYGILLDMVGGKNAVFPKESYSMYFAPSVVNKVWRIAAELGYSNYFINKTGPPLTDDHLYINKIAGIPSIDIIHYEVDNYRFNETWHTHDDNLENIDKNTLHVVGHTLLEVLYREK
jgi:Zn-dependent M28 family amino/carboxypeptidase